MKRAKRVEQSEKMICCLKMTTYHPYKVNLSKGQKDKLRRALKSKNPFSLRLKKTQLSGNDQLMLTANQIKRIQKAASQGKGAEIKVSKAQAQKVGGSIFSALVPLARSVGPMLAKTLGLSALAGLASEVVKKISGKGVTGGFLIPQDKIQKLIANKHLLTNKQREQILSALQTGGQIVVKPSAKQSGGALGALLASIGIPLAIEAVKKVFGKGAQRPDRAQRGKGAPRIGRPKGKGAPRMGKPKSGASVHFPLEPPPPFVGKWEGSGKKSKKGAGLLLGEKSPFQNIPILGAIL